MAPNRRWLTHVKLDPELIKAARKIPKEIRQFVRLRDDGLCRYCGLEATRRGMYWSGSDGSAIDHVLPVYLGGQPTPDNLVLSCYGCNGRKGSRTLQEIGMRLLPVSEAT